MPRLPGGVEAFGGPRQATPARRRRAMAAARPIAAKSAVGLARMPSTLHAASSFEYNAALAARGTQSDRRLDAGQLSENILSSPAAVALALARQLGSAAATQGSTPDRAAQISE